MAGVSLAILTLAFGCIDMGSYIVDTDEATRIVNVLDQWAGERDFARTNCAEYSNFPAAIKGACFELGRPAGATESVLIAEELEQGHGVRIWISFRGTAESKRAQTLESLGSALAAEFGPENVRPDTNKPR